MGYIYKITNKKDSNIYIGQTLRDIDIRWKEHAKKKSNCRYLSSAIKKYGIDNFEFKLVCITFDDKLDDMESYYINKHNCLVPNGYNLKSGGNGGKHSEETKKKISDSLKNRTDIVHSKPRLGKQHTEITKKKISDKLKGRKIDPEIINKMVISNRKYKIIQLDKNGTVLNYFNSCIEAGIFLGTNNKSINLCCNNHRKTAHGYIWKYESIKTNIV
jgi:group I intron endonuclease